MFISVQYCSQHNHFVDIDTINNVVFIIQMKSQVISAWVIVPTRKRQIDWDTTESSGFCLPAHNRTLAQDRKFAVDRTEYPGTYIVWEHSVSSAS